MKYIYCYLLFFVGMLFSGCSLEIDNAADLEANEIQQEFVPITAGMYWMGSPDGTCSGQYPSVCEEELGRNEIENLHAVELSYNFEISRYETMQHEFQTVTRWNPSYFGVEGEGGYCGGNCPVENLTWYDALTYANLVSIEAGLEPCYILTEITCQDSNVASSPERCMNPENKGVMSATVSLNGVELPQQCEGYRLPTEAEWEYAIRAGNEYTAFYQSEGNNGTITYESHTPLDPNLDQIAWYKGNVLEFGTKPAGMKVPNHWGLYDMSGNVWEWTWDCSGPYAITDEDSPLLDPLLDPTAYNAGPNRVIRGGSWDNVAAACRSANRAFGPPRSGYYNVGFRLARTIQ